MKDRPWYKRLFAKEPLKVEFLGTTTLNSSYIFSRKKSYFDVAVYRQYNPETNQTKCIYSNVRGHGAIYYDVCAYEKMGQLVMSS